MLKYCFISCLLLICLVESKVRYDNYTLYRILPENREHVEILKNLQSDYRYDFWTDPAAIARHVDILASPSNKAELQAFLQKNNMRFDISMANIQEEIDKEVVKPYMRGNLKSMTWDSYHTNEQINDWLRDLAETYPDVVTLQVAGKSYEDRDIMGIRISHGEGKRAIFLEAGIHSREWISPATTCFIANELINSEDPEVQKYAREYDWYIFPVTNPDGYIWSHESARLWRKNRRPVRDGHIGVDLNRNWNSNWMVVGASSDPWSETYAGSGPFSEPETRHLSTFIRSIGDRIDIYLSIHSYGQMLLVPFGNTTEPLANYDEAVNVGRRAMGALSVKYDTQYVTGNIAEVIYLATGGSDEWVKEALHVPLVYCYELRPGDSFPSYGFLLPASQIRASGEETLDSIIDLIHQGRRFGVISGAGTLEISLLALFAALIALVA